MIITTTSTAEIATFTCGGDNIGVLIHDRTGGATVGIDAPNADGVRAALAATGWTLSHLLLTHHHLDHVEAVGDLRTTNVAVIGAASDAHRLPPLDRAVGDGETIELGSLSFAVIAAPGHTLGHLAYLLDGEPKALFAGDTLFTLGCGRLFEGTPATMWSTLQRFSALPAETLVWGGHDYTAANARFAESFAGTDKGVATAVAAIRAEIAAGRPTVPTTIGFERAGNPFLRAGDPAFAASVKLAGQPAVEVFAATRRAKDQF